MSDRTLELILKVNNQSTQAIQQLKGEIQGLLKDVQALIDQLEKARSGGGSTGGSGSGSTGGGPKAPGTSKDETEALIRFAQQLKITYAEAEQLTKSLGLTADQSRFAIAELRKFESVKLAPEEQFSRLNAQLGISQKQFSGLQAAAGKALGNSDGGAGGLLASLTAGAGGVVGAVTGIAFAFNQVTQAVQTAFAIAQPFYDALIASNERLNQQILSSQTNLASSTRIFRDGKELTDATEKIKSTQTQISAALKQIEKDTQSLVGVTSSEVNELFQITLTNAAALNNQSKEFPDPISAATSLTKGWAASLKVIGVDFFQARQEINSILKGQIDQNSVLAKNLNLTNQQVEKWRANGTLVDELNKRLNVFVAGNAIAARSIGGIGSNIKDLFETVTREGGKPLLEPIIQVLAFTENALKGIKPQLVDTLAGVSQGVADVLSGLGAAFQPALEQVGKSLQGLFSSVGGFFNEIKEGFGPGISAAFSGIAEAIGSVLGNAISGAINAARLLFDVLKLIASNPAIQVAFNALGQTIGLLGQAIAAVVNTLTSFNSLVTDSLGGVLNFFSGINDSVSTLGGALDPLIRAFQQVAEIIGAIGGAVFEGVVEKASETALGIVQAFVPVQEIAAIFNTVKDTTVGLLQAIQSAFNGAFQGVKDTVSGVFKGITDQLNGLVNNPAFQAIAKALNIDTSQLGKQLDEINNKYKDVGQSAKDAGKEAKDAGNIEIKARQAPDLGTQFDQIKEKLASTKRILEEAPEGQEFAAAVKERIKLLEQAAEKGLISADDAESELRAIQNNVKIEKDLQEQAAQTAIKINKNALDTQLGDFKATQAEIEAQVKNKQITEEEGARRITEAKKAQLQTQLSDVQEQLRLEQDAIERGSGNKNRASQLRTQERELQAQISAETAAGREREAQARESQRKKELDRQRKDLDIQAQVVQNNVAKGVTAEVDGAKQVTNIKREELKKQLQAVEENLKAAQAAGDGSRVKDLTLERKKLLADIDSQEIEGRKRVAQAREQETSIARKQINAQISLTQAAVEAGTTKEIDGAKKVTQLRKLELDKQLADVRKSIEEEQKANPGKASPRLKELQAEEAKLRADRKRAEVDGEKDVRQAILEEFERSQRKATSVAKLAETERLQEVQKLINKGILLREEASAVQLESQRKGLESELQLAKEAQAKLEALPKSNNPKQEEDRQQQIREARQKTADLSLQLLQNEQAQQEAALALIKRKLDEQVKVTRNQVEAEKQGYERQNQLIEAGNRILNQRSQLLEAQKNLVKAASDLQQSGYRSAIDLLQSQFDTEDKILDRQKQRAELQKRASEGDSSASEELQKLNRQEARERQLLALKIEAKQREIESLNIQQELELRSLDIEEQKTLLLQKQEEIRARIAVSEAKAQQAQAVADAAKINADPNATAADREAARLNVDAANQRRQGAEENQQLIQQSGAVNQETFAQRRQAIAANQQQQRIQQQTELQILNNQQGAISGFQPTQAITSQGVLNQARAVAIPVAGQGGAGQSPLIQLASQQTSILTDSKAAIDQSNLYLKEIMTALQRGGGSTGTNITNNISGQIDPNKAADEATKRTIAAMKSAFTTAGRR